MASLEEGVLRPFAVGGLDGVELWDFRTPGLPRAHVRASIRVLDREISSLLARSRPDTRYGEGEGPQLRRERAGFLAWVGEHPIPPDAENLEERQKARLRAYQAAHPVPPGSDESDVDPRLKVIQFVGFDLEGVAGGWLLYNVRRRGRPGTFAAMPAPGLVAPGHPPDEAIAAVLLHFLDNELELADTSTRFDLQEWRFPQRGPHRWQNVPDEVAAGQRTATLALEHLEDAGVRVIRTGQGIPIRAFRSGR
ncbi:MAG: hypothetical protein V3S03_08440 [Vicinamibacteria bacterium]